jgi:integrase
MYVDFIKGIDVDDHRKRIRGDRTVKSFVRYYNRFITSLKEKGIETPTLSIYDIEDKQVGIYSAYVKALPQVKTNSSYNDHFKKMGAFYSYLKNELRHDIVNPFDRVVRMKEVKKNIHITQNEFDIFLSMIKPENGRHLTMKEANSNTFVIVYKPWQAQAFRLAILTGVRSQNLFELKWSDVHETVIQIENIKYNNSGNKEIQKVKEFFYAIRTKELNDLLIELGEEKNIGTDRYLLEPDSKLKRSSLKFYASIGFTHFWRLTGFSKKATLHSLRSTALTNFKIIMRENISALNTHKSDKVREGNYENQTAILSNYAGKEFYGR